MKDEDFFINRFSYKGFEIVILKNTSGKYIVQILQIDQGTNINGVRINSFNSEKEAEEKTKKLIDEFRQSC